MKATETKKLTYSCNREVVELNTEKLRKRLLTIETDIKTIIGPRKEKDWVDVPVDINRGKLENLLQSRRY